MVDVTGGPVVGPPEKVMVTARRGGAGGVIQFTLPASMSRAVPAGNHEFEAEFTPAGILLTYVGPAPGTRRPNATLAAPKWAQS